MTKTIQDKYAIPNKLISAPIGTVSRVLTGDDDISYYIQLSPGEDSPKWETIGTFFQEAFENFLDNDDFIKECLKLYSFKEPDSFHKIKKIIKENSPL